MAIVSSRATLLALILTGVALPASAGELILVSGIPLDFILFGLTLLGVALFHNYTLYVGLTGLLTITLYKLIFSGFKGGDGLAGLGLAPFDRLQIGCRHLAGLLDQLAHVLRHRLEIGHGRKLAERRFRRLWPGLALLVSWRTHDGAPLDSHAQELHSPFWTH